MLPLRYPIKRMGAYFCGALGLWAVGSLVEFDSAWLTMAVRTPLLLVYLLAILKFERIWR